jgi:hypothetical protein
METVERDGLGLDLHVDGDGSSSEEEGVRRDDVPQAAEVTGDVVGQYSIGESLEREAGFVEELKRDDGTIIEDPALKEQDDHSQGYERSNSSGTTDYTMADSPSSSTSPDIECPQNLSALPLADHSKADIKQLDEMMHSEVLPDEIQADAQDFITERGSPRPHSDGAEFTPREAVEATEVLELNQPVQEQMGGPSQGSAPSKVDTKDSQDATSPISPDSSSSSFPLPRGGLPDAGTASAARVLRELKQLGIEKRSSIVLGPTRRASVLSTVLPTSPERLVSRFVKTCGV